MPLHSGQTVMLKTLFLDKPFAAKITEADSVGIWVDAVEMSGWIQRVAAGTGPAAIPPEKQFLKGYPLLFVPFSQVQWIGGQKSLQR